MLGRQPTTHKIQQENCSAVADTRGDTAVFEEVMMDIGYTCVTEIQEQLVAAWSPVIILRALSTLTGLHCQCGTGSEVLTGSGVLHAMSHFTPVYVQGVHLSM
ncbi:Hypothetical predicted protein [Pelobates cultripes]|uniref:Uncharacterized protein n=1 Tax=Pelobates cultripes TaxID=61616 RepID=A0AAD1SKI7_PELCU|nr:Hypothetical predicted protein [Pelobates cultripes]